MPDHKPFSGFEVIEQLPTGDQRRVFEVGMAETYESLTKNEVVFWVQCQCGGFVDKAFPRMSAHEEARIWTAEILEVHKSECPLEHVEVSDADPGIH
jgi:hypothetical protein